MGNILLHVSDPTRVLRNVRSVTSGNFLSFEALSMTLTLRHPWTASAALSTEHLPRWWTMNLKAHRHLLEATGFTIVDAHFPIFQPFGPGTSKRPLDGPFDEGAPLKWLTFWTTTRWLGVPSAWTLCS